MIYPFHAAVVFTSLYVYDSSMSETAMLNVKTLLESLF
jgi:hypothetical protein